MNPHSGNSMTRGPFPVHCTGKVRCFASIFHGIRAPGRPAPPWTARRHWRFAVCAMLRAQHGDGNASKVLFRSREVKDRRGPRTVLHRKPLGSCWNVPKPTIQREPRDLSRRSCRDAFELFDKVLAARLHSGNAVQHLDELARPIRFVSRGTREAARCRSTIG